MGNKVTQVWGRNDQGCDKDHVGPLGGRSQFSGGSDTRALPCTVLPGLVLSSAFVLSSPPPMARCRHCLIRRPQCALVYFLMALLCGTAHDRLQQCMRHEVPALPLPMTPTHLSISCFGSESCWAHSNSEQDPTFSLARFTLLTTFNLSRQPCCDPRVVRPWLCPFS